MPANRLLKLVACATALLLTACSASGPSQPQQQPQSQQGAAPGRTEVYECGDYEFVTRTTASGIALYLPNDYFELEPVESASGSKYAAAGISLWSKGDEALLDLGYRRYSDCRLNRARIPWEEARRRGVQFRAVGQEPGWYLEIQDYGQMLLVSGYGSQRVLLPTPEPVTELGAEVYFSADAVHQLRVEIRQQHCVDSMSGEVFDHRVLVVLNDSSLNGCGLALEPR